MTAKIKLNAASGGGSVSLQAPSSSSNNRVFTILHEVDATLLTSNTSTGKILQVKQVVKTDTFSLAASSTNQRIDITGLTIDITPSSASNKILVDYRVNAVSITTKWSLQSNDPFNERFFRYLYWRSRFWIN